MYACFSVITTTSKTTRQLGFICLALKKQNLLCILYVNQFLLARHSLCHWPFLQAIRGFMLNVTMALDDIAANNFVLCCHWTLPLHSMCAHPRLLFLSAVISAKTHTTKQLYNILKSVQFMPCAFATIAELTMDNLVSFTSRLFIACPVSLSVND